MSSSSGLSWRTAPAFLILVTGCVAPLRMAVVASPGSCRTVQPWTSSSAVTGVLWIGPDDEVEARRLDQWCDSVGPVIFESTAHSSVPSADMVAIVTWNTHVGAGDIVELVARLRRGTFTEGRQIDHFVLLLQEVYRQGSAVPGQMPQGFRAPRSLASSKQQATVLEIAHALDLNVMYAPSMRDGPGQQDRGNAIMSTLPLDNPIAVELPLERQRRVSIAARAHGQTSEGTPWELAVASTHFDTSIAATRGGPAAARARQARALIEALSVFDKRLVVAGDLNTWWGDDEPAAKELRRAFPDAQPAPSRQTTWRGPGGVGTRVDHLFARLSGQRVAVRRLPDPLGSDHYPLLAILQIKN